MRSARSPVERRARRGEKGREGEVEVAVKHLFTKVFVDNVPDNVQTTFTNGLKWGT